MKSQKKSSPKTPKLGHQKDLAGLLDISPQAVSKGAKKGWITIRPDGLIDLEQAVKDWYAHCDMSQKRPFNAQSGSKSASHELDRYLTARADHEQEKAQLAKMERQRLDGTVLDAEMVKRHTIATGRLVRDRLRQIPKRLAPILVGLDERQITRKLAEAVDEALRALVNQINKGGRHEHKTDLP